MGVKSTVTLKRADAEEKYVKMMLERPEFKRKFRSEAAGMSERDLEWALERLNYEAHDGEGFENYIVTE